MIPPCLHGPRPGKRWPMGQPWLRDFRICCAAGLNRAEAVLFFHCWDPTAGNQLIFLWTNLLEIACFKVGQIHSESEACPLHLSARMWIVATWKYLNSQLEEKLQTEKVRDGGGVGRCID
ncbi:hypothetical protein Y1Q_0017299 [Alligator mississippiensis]|uniref:Uncharacterized protein n=1 Tax=Alligator mississippiensis TaxID=8496 RepID=A0A151NUL5_ALLMI|nr:hypothetical protein Y1Q_0017299 [Alligator mississippiensis]